MYWRNSRTELTELLPTPLRERYYCPYIWRSVPFGIAQTIYFYAVQLFMFQWYHNNLPNSCTIVTYNTDYKNIYRQTTNCPKFQNDSKHTQSITLHILHLQHNTHLNSPPSPITLLFFFQWEYLSQGTNKQRFSHPLSSVIPLWINFYVLFVQDMFMHIWQYTDSTNGIDPVGK